MSRSGRRTAVLGGGALGLTAALRLQQRGRRVTVIEREGLPGGLAAGFQPDPGGAWLEKFYHHLFRSDRRAVALIEELGLGGRLQWKAPVTATLRDGRIHRLDSPGSLLRFAPLGMGERLRMGAALALLKAMPTPRLLEGRTAAVWLRTAMGGAGYETVWEPLLRGKFGAHAEEVAMPWLWARVHDRTTQLGYLRGGFQQLYDVLAERIADAGGEVRLRVSVERVTRDGDALRVDTAEGSERFDDVVSTLAPRLTARLAPELPASWRERHEWGTAFGAHCLVLALDRALTDAYWVNVNDPGYPFMVLVEHTNFVPADDYGGRHLVYLGNYRPMDDPLMRADRQAVVDEFLPHLARLAPGFERSWVTGSWAFAAPWAQPIVTTDYRFHIPRFDTPVPGLYLASMFQVYPHDRGQNYSIALAERLATRLT